MIPALLVLNAGSSSLKFQVFEDRDEGGVGHPRPIFRGLVERLGEAPVHHAVPDRGEPVAVLMVVQPSRHVEQRLLVPERPARGRRALLGEDRPR